MPSWRKHVSTQCGLQYLYRHYSRTVSAYDTKLKFDYNKYNIHIVNYCAILKK